MLHRLRHTVKDPVCGMEVDPPRASTATSMAARTYHFCCAGCRAKFAADPERYLGEKAPAAASARGAIYTCPMHPEVRQVGPGACPICGMALEPEDATAEAGPNPELADMTRRSGSALALAVPVVALEMGGHLLGLHAAPWRRRPRTGCSSLLATPVVLWAGWPFFERGWASLVSRNLNMFTLIALGTGVAWVYSVVATAGARPVPARLPRHGRRGRGLFRGRGGDHRPGPARPGAGAARARADRAAPSGRCSTSRPRPRAGCAPDGSDEEVALDAVLPGDRLRVRPGDRVPVDGVVLEGPAPSTRAWSPASRCRSRSSPGAR